jgi:primase-polymerase (primpol)-like protein
MPILARSHARTCSNRCRMAASRARRTVPAELTSRPRWIRRTARKVPLTVEGESASSTNPATWSRHREAARSTAGAGLGFVLDGDGIVCLDLDHALDGEGAVTGWAQGVLDAAAGCWVEVSASGRGLHIWGYGTLPHGRKLRVGDGSVEAYGDGRYIAVTGVTFLDAPQRLGDLGPVLTELGVGSGR